jgi:hypothetical protein
MAVGTFSGAKVYIGGTDRFTDAPGYDGETWTEISEVANIGEFGPEANVLTYQTIGDEIVRKSKGTRDNGDLVLRYGYDGFDSGQNALRAAEDTKFIYNFKIELADKLDSNDTNTIYYFGAIVGSAKNQGGGNEDFVEEASTLGITTEIVYVAPTVVA